MAKYVCDYVLRLRVATEFHTPVRGGEVGSIPARGSKLSVLRSRVGSLVSTQKMRVRISQDAPNISKQGSCRTQRNKFLMLGKHRAYPNANLILKLSRLF